MSSYVFPGYPAYLESAAADLGHPESAGPARLIAPLTALANLCAQASHGDPAHLGDILAKAAEFRDQLATALRAAESMLVDVEAAGRRPMLPGPEAQGDAGPSAGPAPPPPPPAARRGPKNSRGSL